jgi:hypothetical protein
VSLAWYLANPVVSRRDEADGTLLYNPDVDDIAVINGSGIAVFAYLAEPRTVDDIAAHLVDTYDGVGPEQAAADAAAFVEQLSPTYIIEVDEDGEPIAAADEAEQADGAARAGGEAQ